MNTLIAKNLAQEYEYLLEKPILSDDEDKRITTILQLAESDESLNTLIRKSEHNWFEKNYYYSKENNPLTRFQELEELFDLIDQEIDRIR